MKWFNIHDELNEVLVSHYKKYGAKSGKELSEVEEFTVRLKSLFKLDEGFLKMK